jgi:hypothetical protein
MRGDPKASTRLLASGPGRRWSAWRVHTKRRKLALRNEQLEVIERLGAEERRARRTGEYTPDIRRW